MDVYSLMIIVFQMAISGRPTADCASSLKNRGITSALASSASAYLATNPATLSAAQIAQMSSIVSALSALLD